MEMKYHDMNERIQRTLKNLGIGTALVAVAIIPIPRPAQADTTSTALIIAGAAAIVGALLLDSNNRPYYVNNNRRYYVTQDEANYYRTHRQVVQRQAWVPENEYPVQRNAGYRFPVQKSDRGRGNQGHPGQGNGNRPY